MRHLACFLTLTVGGCIGGGRCAADDAAAALALAAAMPAKTAVQTASCQCPNGGPCSCGPDCPCGTACSCVACPGRTAVTLESLKSRAMADNKRLVVWTGTAGRNVPDCLACRDERFRAVSLPRPFVSVGVPSANGLVWWQFAANVPDSLLQTVRTDGTHDAAASPPPVYYQPGYPNGISQGPQFAFGGNCSH